MTNARERPTAEELNRLAHKWWETTVINATGEYVWDEEIKAVNAMTAEIDEFPEWALQVRDAMPKYGFEMCSHRWLDGLDDAIRMVGAEEFWPSSAGRCGDVPGKVASAAEGRAAAVQSWMDGRTPKGDGLQRQVAEWLGEQSPEKRGAATCFVELVRSFFFEPRPNEAEIQVAKRWRARGEENEILATMFEGHPAEGFDGLLQNRCGFKVIDRLDLYIRMIGGDQSQAAERHGVCNTQLRYVFRDDPARYQTTRGYLWGLEAYLLGRDEGWLRSAKPECAGAAIYTLQGVSRAGAPTPLRRWLVASLLKSTKIWCQAALNRLREGPVPIYTGDLPDVVAVVQG